jgi:hypothetical protein
MENNGLLMLNECLTRFNRSRDRPTYETSRARVLEALSDADATDLTVEVRLIELAHSGDGYLRQAAVRQLGKGRSETAFRVLLERCNDWVPQVRQAALSSANAFLQTARLPAVLASLGAILRLKGKSRADHGDFIDRVGAFLDHPDSRPALLAFYPESRGPVACFLSDRMFRWEGEVLAEVDRLSSHHRDFLVRSCFLAACQARGSEGEKALHGLLDDPHPRNRRKAFLALWQRTLAPAERQALLGKALLDPYGAVHDVALWAAKQIGFDLADFVTAQGNGESLDRRAYLGVATSVGCAGKHRQTAVDSSGICRFAPEGS